MNPSRPAAAVIDALMAPAGRADPFPLYARAHELGPVAAIADGAFLVCGYAAVDQVLRDPGFGLPEPSGSTYQANRAGSEKVGTLIAATL